MPDTAQRRARIVLLASLLALAAESLMTSGALLDLQLRVGAIPAAVAALVTYVLPGVVVGVVVLATRRRLGASVLVAVGLLVLARLVLQLLVELPRFVLGLGTVAIAVAALVLATVLTAAGGGDRAAGARDAASGLVLGLGLTAAVAGVTGTWAAVWRSDWLGWLVTLALLGAAGWSAWTLRGDEASEAPRGVWVLGPFLGVGTFALASPAFLASQAQVTPGLGVVDALAHVLIVLAAAGSAVLAQRAGGRATRLGLALPALVAAGYLLLGATSLTPVPMLLVLLAGIPAAGLLVLAALHREPRPVSPWRLAGLGVGVGLGAILPLLIYQIDYDIPLGVPNALVIVAATVLLAIGSRAWRAAGRTVTTSAGVSLVPAAGVVVVGLLGLAATVPAGFEAERTEATTLRILNWNVHYGVTPEVAVDLEAFARTIEEHDPDVVALQEVSRGWLLGGGTDIATWLSRRLDMGLVYAHAADRQFGNALLAKAELSDVAVTQLPYGEGPMRRSAITATVHLADGTPVRVSSMHLQHKEENTPTRLEQLDAAIADIVPTGPSILAGDLNARPGWPEIEAMEAAGWVSAIDAVGDPAALTFSTWDPVERIDWVFGQHVVPTRAEVLPDTSSDHFAILVEANPAP